MIRFAEKKDIEAIRRLWDIAFGEDKEFSDYFFNNVFDYKNTLVYESDKIAATVQMLPYYIEGIGNVTYIYGATTDPNYRKQGIMGQLLKESFEIDKKNGVSASILIPESKPLFDYYKSLGYETCFYCKSTTINYTGQSKGNFRVAEKSDFADMLNLYNKSCELKVQRTIEYFETQYNMFKALDGEVYVMTTESTLSAYAFVSELHPLTIQEIVATNDDALQQLSNYIMEAHTSKTATITTIGDSDPMGMAYFYNKPEKAMYMNLMFN